MAAKEKFEVYKQSHLLILQTAHLGDWLENLWKKSRLNWLSVFHFSGKSLKYFITAVHMGGKTTSFAITLVCLSIFCSSEDLRTWPSYKQHVIFITFPDDLGNKEESWLQQQHFIGYKITGQFEFYFHRSALTSYPIVHVSQHSQSALQPADPTFASASPSSLVTKNFRSTFSFPDFPYWIR